MSRVLDTGPHKRDIARSASTGGRKAGAKLIERLKVFSHLANVGDAKSLVDAGGALVLAAKAAAN